MSKNRVHRKKLWPWLETLRRNSQRFWTSWRRRRLRRKHQNLLKQEELYLLRLDLTRVELKVASSQLEMMELKLREMQEALQYRTTGQLPPQETPDPELNEYLGL